MSRTMRALRRACSDQGGATALEYGLLVALLGLVVAGAVTAAGTKLYTQVNKASAVLAN